MTNSLENTENQLNLKKEEESVHLLDVLKGKSDIFLSFNACLRRLLSSFYFEKGDLFYIVSLFFCFCEQMSADWRFRVLKTRPGVFQFSSFLSGITNLFQYFRVSSNPDVSFIHLPIHLRLSKRLLWNWGENNRNQSKKTNECFQKLLQQFQEVF